MRTSLQLSELITLLLVAATAACGGDDESTSASACPEGEQLVDGVGCVSAGMQDNGCPAGQFPGSAGECQRAGIAPDRCAEGFEAAAEQTCSPILPAEACPPGLMAVPGDLACREVAPCAEGTWGAIPVEAGTQYVDQAYAGGASDGSATGPWTTIDQAIDAAEPNAVIAIATGSYVGPVTISGKAVRLWGVCPGLVEIVAAPVLLGALVFEPGSSGSEVHQLALRGRGLHVSGADVVASHLWIHDSARRGVAVEDADGPAGLVLRDSLIERTIDAGVSISGTEVAIETSVIRDVQPVEDLTFGRGVTMRFSSNGARSTLHLSHSVIERSFEIGVAVGGSDATIEASVIRDTQSRASDGQDGVGIYAWRIDPEIASLTLSGSIVERNHAVGVAITGSTAVIDTSVIRDTQPEGMGYGLGRGLDIEDSGVRASATIRESVIERNHYAGALVSGSDVVFEGTVIRETLQPDGPTLPEQARFGTGLVVQDDPAIGSASATLSGCEIAHNVHVGLAIINSDVSLDGVLIHDTYPSDLTHPFGDGAAIVSEPERAHLEVSASRIEQNSRAGLSNFGSDVGVENSLFLCNAFHLDVENNLSEIPFLQDLGGNVCGCAGAHEECRAVSSQLEPPGPLGLTP